MQVLIESDTKALCPVCDRGPKDMKTGGAVTAGEWSDHLAQAMCAEGHRFAVRYRATIRENKIVIRDLRRDDDALLGPDPLVVE